MCSETVQGFGQQPQNSVSCVVGWQSPAGVSRLGRWEMRDGARTDEAGGNVTTPIYGGCSLPHDHGSVVVVLGVN